jgi:hypothetical protein
LDIYNPADWRAVLNATVQAQRSMELDPNLGMFVNVGPEALFVGKLYARWAAFPSAFDGFSLLTPLQTFITPTNGTLKDLVNGINTHTIDARYVRSVVGVGRSWIDADTARRREPQAVSHGVDLDLYTEIHEHYLSLLNSSQTSTATLTYTLQPVGKACVEAGRRSGGNALDLELEPQTCE